MPKLPMRTVVLLMLVGLIGSGCANFGADPTPVISSQAQPDTTAIAWTSEIVADQVPARGNLQRTGEYPDSGDAAPQLSQVLWSSPYYVSMRAGPVVADGTVIFTVSEYHDDNLYAVDATTGKEKWRASTIPNMEPKVADGVLFYLGTDGLHAVEIKTQHEKWVFAKADRGTSTPLIGGGLAYFGVGDGSVYAVDVETGTSKWSVKTPTAEYSAKYGNLSGELVLVGGTLFVTTIGGDLFAFDASTGAQRWRLKAGDGGARQLAVWGDKLYFSAAKYLYPEEAARQLTATPDMSAGFYEPVSPSMQNGIYAVNMQNGQEIWKVEPPKSEAVPLGYPHEGGLNTPIVFDGVVYSVGQLAYDSEPGSVYAFDAASGKQLWQKALPTELWQDSLAASDGLLFVTGIPAYPSADGAPLYALDAKTGEEKWTFRQGAYLAKPLISNGILYTASRMNQRGKLYAIDARSGNEIRSIALQGGGVSDGDALVLRGDTIYMRITDLDVPGDQLIAVK
ncbi:MAG: PQQ-binding-like beta-propeller repeat protein [Chloroflexota bacterium]|nr:PQQ-binding-like beta-propeller repeat protein [Chloroflexota bacterium]